MNDTPPAESKPPGPIPADDPGRVLTHVSPDTDDSLPHLGVVGDTYTILVSGADTAGRYTLIDMHVPPGGGPPPHRHDFEEMFTILDGEIELTFRGVSAVANGGRNDQCAGQRPARLPERLRTACAAAVSLLARGPGGVLQGGRRSGRAPNRGSTARSTMPPPPRSSPRRSRSPRSTGPSCCSATRSPDPRNRKRQQ